MKVLIGCEFSGIVRDAFINLGHDAISCDLLPSLSSRGPHYQGNIFDILYSEKWDLLVAFPPCTYLTVAGNRWFIDPARIKLREDAFRFVLRLYNAPVKRVCIENPAGYLSTHFRKPDQIINPYLFGDNEIKRTCLWLRGLPKLYYTVQFPLKPLPVVSKKGNNMYFHDLVRCSNTGLSISSIRSKTFPGVARAMASQWGGGDGDYFFQKY